MGKTLIIAEKPSVAGDIAKALGGCARDKSGEFYEGDQFVVSSAVGHLLELVVPEEHDVKRGKWTFNALPHIPPQFGLQPIARSESRLKVLLRLIKRKDVDALINAAGTNTPHRSLEVLSSADYRHLIDTNLNGAYWCVQAFLPSMRTRSAGTIVNVISDAARQASPKAGPAYSASKFGLLGLTQAINAEERPHGIRACALLPGVSSTELLSLL